MTDDSKKLPDLGFEVEFDLDPDATAVVDARSVWAALERAAGPLPPDPTGESSVVRRPATTPPLRPLTPPPAPPPAPPASLRAARPKEEEELDQAWEDSFDMSDLAETREAPSVQVPEASLSTQGANANEASKPTAPPPAEEPALASASIVPEPLPTRPALAEDGQSLRGSEDATHGGEPPMLDSDLLDEEPHQGQSGISTARPPADHPIPAMRQPSASNIVTPVGGIASVSVPGPETPLHGVAAAPASAPPSRRRGPSAVDMEDRFSMGDFSGAMEIAEELLARDPSHADAIECLERCRTALHDAYTTKLGPLDRVPLVAIPREQLRWLTIDHRAGFILSHVDGISNLEEIIDISGMPELDALRILSELAQQRIIAFR